MFGFLFVCLFSFIPGLNVSFLSRNAAAARMFLGRSNVSATGTAAIAQGEDEKKQTLGDIYEVMTTVFIE